jgi:transaldolase
VSVAENLTPMHLLSVLGQSAWIDNISRETTRDGGLQKLIDEYSIVGATSNPTIFEKAMTAGDAYEEQLRELDSGLAIKDVFWTLAEADIREACDIFRPVWESGSGRDGYVSLEVDPGLAYDTLATFREAIRIHTSVDRPNLMVKIPATKPGLAAIEDVTAKGRSINFTLIFSLERYEQVAESYVRGLERLVAAGGDPSKVASVASFFVSRIDTETDKRLEAIGGHDELKGKLAIANARLAYQSFKAIFAGPRWEYLESKGATAQRVLWASTSVKNPDYRDTMYVEELIGADTVDTIPRETIEDFQDHGVARARLESELEQARKLFDELAEAGVDYIDVTDTLEREGVEKFAASFAELMQSLEQKRSSLVAA